MDERSLPAQRDLIGWASLYPAQCRDVGDNVGVAEEGEGDPLALTRLQHTVQRQDVENLQRGEERSRCQNGCRRAAMAWSKGQMWLEGPLPQTPAQSF